MKLQPLLVVLTLVNAVVLGINLVEARPSHAQDVAPVLRARALQIVDDHGRVRASIAVLSGDPALKMPDGTVGYPETVLLRLIDQHGRPNVKLFASEQGGGLGVGGEKDPTYARMMATGPKATLDLINQDGRQTAIKP